MIRFVLLHFGQLQILSKKRQVPSTTINLTKILDLKWSSEQIFSEN